MKKYSELIHNSSHGNPDFARVTIFFKRIIKNREPHLFNISRYVFKDNKTKYQFCGKDSTKDKIKTYLKEQGIGLDHDRFIILQGEVENISLLKPKAEKENEDGMLEFLDDIIGTAIYKKPIEELNNGVIEMYKEVVFKKAKCNEAEHYKMILFDQVTNIVRTMRINNSIIEWEYKINCFEMVELQRKIDNIQKKLTRDINLEKELDEDEKRLDQEIKNYNERKCQNLKKIESEKTEMDKIKKEISDLTNEELKNKLKQESVTKEIDCIIETNKKLFVEIEIMTKQPKEINKKLTILKEKLENENSEINTIAQKKIIAEEEFVRKKKALYDTELNERDGKVQEEKSKLREIINDKDKLMIKLNELSFEKNYAMDAVDELKKSIKIKDDLLDSTGIEYNVWKDKLNNINNEILSEEVKHRNISEKMNSVRNEIENERKELLEFKNNYDLMISVDLEPVDKISEYLMKLNYKGFRGRLGDLCHIDKKYDIALSTLGGKLLDNYVVDTVEDAQYLINKLRVDKIGKGSFMVIDKIAVFDKMNEKRKYPLQSQRAFDLLNIFDPNIMKCFYFILRESLVVNTIDDIEPLKKALFGNFKKIVTLDGTIFENSGKITGGGRPLSGKIGAKNCISNKETTKGKEEYQARVKEKEYKLSKLQEEYNKLLNSKNSIKKILNKLNLNLETYSQKITIIKRTLETNEKSKELLKKQLSDAIDRMNEIKVDEESKRLLENQIEKCQEEIFQKEKSLNEIQNEYNTINDKILELRNNILGCLEKEYNQKLENTNLLREEISQTNKNLKKLEHKLYRTTTSLHDNEQKLDKLNNTINNLNTTEETSKNRMVKLKNLLSQSIELVNNLQNNYNNNKKYIGDLQIKKNDVSNRLSIVKISLEKDNLELHKSKKHFDKLEILKNNARYTFFKEMIFLPDDIISFSTDESFYNKNVYNAEKEFVQMLDNYEYNEENGLVYVNVKPYAIDEIENMSYGEVGNIKKKLGSLHNMSKVPIDTDIINEFIKRSNRLISSTNIFNEFKEIYDNLKNKYEKMTEIRLQEFNKGFNIISRNIKQIYQQITFGGDAEIEPIDKFDPYNYGIVFKVRPPEKCWKKIMNLSGGEKTLASLSLVFALHSFNPVPFYIMDEIDAALDFRNVRIIADYINERTQNAQFIVISLRKEMYEQCKKLLGVWKLCDSTYCLIQKLDEHKKGCNYNIFSEDHSESRKLNDIYDSLKALFT
uniref:Structural maintenance of chromosomes protein n=1 Tax=Strongyloides papillosus TaxID=174720 RepID=A0A0N5BWV0_STREA